VAELLSAVLNAHGGTDNWRRFNRIDATIVTFGGLWAVKGQPQDAQPRHMIVALDREWASLHPFGSDDQKTAFAPERIAIEKLDGRVFSERLNPRDSFLATSSRRHGTPYNARTSTVTHCGPTSRHLSCWR
jgi:hypothetical protein